MRVRKRVPIALPPLLSSDFISYVLRQHGVPTKFIICSTRDVFLGDLQTCIRPTRYQGTPSSSSEEMAISLHPFSVPNIHLLANCQNLHLVFTPTLAHLRAYLAAYNPIICPQSSASKTPNPEHRLPMLAIWGLANLHRSTVEYSAQGLSRTLATAVEAAKFGGQQLVLAEPKEAHLRSEYNGTDVLDQLSDDPWKDQIPLLSGSIRFGSEERAWAGKTIEVRSVVSRWCKFVHNIDEEILIP